MTLINTSIAEKTRDLIAPISNYSLYLGHEASGETVMVDAAPAAQQLFGDIILSSATSSFDSINYAPDGAQGQKIATALSAAAYDMQSLSGVGQFIISFDIFADSAPSGTEVVLGLGKAVAGEGRIRIDLSTAAPSGKISFANISGADGATTVTRNSSVTVYDGAWHNVVCYIDCVNLKIGMYVDGVPESEQTIDSSADLITGLLTTARGFWPFANMSGDAAYNLQLGSASTGTKINRLLMMRTTEDQSDNLASIASGLNTITHELPWSVDGV